ncbi:MAG TPA: redoxin domain-containing protein [Candidatus Angelobacter sp.]|jgi:peroxiredoxin|nr:redoxin domain-containing protein [Candidatus Angelobacter sp.]
MRNLRKSALVVAAAVLMIGGALAVKIGAPAPGFGQVDSNGKMHKLSDYRGKYVVLEWHNQGCPYTEKHYNSGNMQRLQKEWTGKGVVWFTVISSGPGKQGFVTPAQENEYLTKMKAAPTAVLMDPAGTLGHLYDAKTTPEMFVIDPQGTLIYQGAIDDRPTSDQADIAGAKNYVNAALTEAMAGKPVTEAATRPYGCSVKYGKF